MAAPTPHDLGRANDPDLSWESFEAQYPAAEPQPDPPEPEAG